MGNMSKVIVGLGNPGKEYAQTRHNAGAMWVEGWRQKHGLPEWKLEKKFNGLLSRGQIKGEEVILLLPQTFMNLSGESVAALLNFYRLSASEDLLVVYDDLDLEFGHYKISRQTPRGHNGVNNIIEKLGGSDFAQVRIGTDARGGERTISGMDYVLMKMTSEEQEKWAREIFPEIMEVVEGQWLLKN